MVKMLTDAMGSDGMGEFPTRFCRSGHGSTANIAMNELGSRAQLFKRNFVTNLALVYLGVKSFS
jgi:hypothetical protein